jgi:uncharacterized protein YjiS (DUF1127 family)
MEGLMSRMTIRGEAYETALVARVAAVTFRQFRRVITALKHRRAINGLAELDERALKDIGLLPSDVHGALAEPFYRDPSTVLLLRSVERRAAMRALARVPSAATARPAAAVAAAAECAPC